MATLNYYKLSLQWTFTAYDYQQKKNLSFLFVLTSIVCVQNLTQFVYNTEQNKFAPVILVMTTECICEWLLTIAETTSKPHCFLPTQNSTV